MKVIVLIITFLIIDHFIFKFSYKTYKYSFIKYLIILKAKICFLSIFEFDLIINLNFLNLLIINFLFFIINI